MMSHRLQHCAIGISQFWVRAEFCDGSRANCQAL